MGYIAKPPLVVGGVERRRHGPRARLARASTRCAADIRRTRELTDKPFGVNLPLAFVRDPAIVDMIVDEGVEFVTTSAGSPDKYTSILKDAGLIVFHVVPTLRARPEGGRRRRRRPRRGRPRRRRA